MRQRGLVSLLMFISSYSPLFIILAIKDFDFEKMNFQHITAIIILLGIVFLSILLLYILFKCFYNKGGINVKINEVRNRSVDLINYTIPYILSFFGFDLSKWGDILSLGLFLSIMYLLTIRSKSIFLNPILALVGYGLYDVEYTYNGINKTVAILSKYDLKENKKYKIKRLNRFTYITTKDKNEG